MFIKQFNKYCKETKFHPVGRAYSTRRLFESGHNLLDYIDSLKCHVSKNSQVDLLFDDVIPEGSWVIDSNNLSLTTNSLTINSLTIRPQNNSTGNLVFRDLLITNCDVSCDRGKSAPPVEFINCKIVKLALSSDAKITLTNCQIGTMNLISVNNLRMISGCVLNFGCTVPASTNPFTGSIIFSETFLANSSKKYLIEGPQPYRNIRYHLREIENVQMANLFHSAELALEREDDTFFNKFISYAYQLFSDFGSSTGRPIFWWFLIETVVAFIMFYFDGAIPAFSDTNKYPGWKSILAEDNCTLYCQIARAQYLSFQNMLNPLGFLGTKSLIVPAFELLVFLLSVQGLLSAILIALMIFAVRRRFKMN